MEVAVNADEASLCAAWFLTDRGPEPVCGPGVRDPAVQHPLDPPAVNFTIYTLKKKP